MTREDAVDEICYAGASQLADRIRTKTLSPVEVVRAHLDRIEAVNPRLNAIVTVADGAVERAREAEAAVMRGEIWGPLHGVPFTVKDWIDTAGVRTTRCSRLFEDRVPRDDATVVRRLKDAGGVLIGKTNAPEFGISWETENLLFGRTENPWNGDHSAGGSSGGEASAIAAGLSPLGVGSDLGGSVREPAAHCGVVGLKATHGRVPLTGHWPAVLPQFLHIGALSRTVRDVAVALYVTAGADGLDPYATGTRLPPLEDPAAPITPLRVGWCVEGAFAPVDGGIDEAVSRAASSLEELGCLVEKVSFDAWDRWSLPKVSSALYAAEARSYLEPAIVGREEHIAPSMRRLLDFDRPTSREREEALSGCEALNEDMARFFGEHELLVCPTSPIAPPLRHARSSDIAPRRMEALRAMMPFNLTGLPAMSIPFGWSEGGLPIGVQLVGRRYEEPILLRAASALEAVRGDSGRRPPV